MEDLPGAREALVLGGPNDDGWAPLVEAIAARYRVEPARVATATGTSGANFLACVALLEPGDDVLVERPGYDPLIGAAHAMGARTVRFDRTWEQGFALDPDRVRAALTPATRLIMITNLHNPSGVLASTEALVEIGAIAEQAGAHVLVDEVYLDTTFAGRPQPAAHLGGRFISTSSLTKSYGLSGLRCGWALAAPDVAERIRRARDVVDGTGAVPTEVLSVLAFQHLDRLAARARSILLPNFQAVTRFLDCRPEMAYVRPAGGTVIFPRFRSLDDTSALVDRLMAEHGTAIVPGRFFEAPSHVRISFGGRSDVVAAGLGRFGQLLDATRW